jgi:Tfp pilus assembly major pilin PilA
MTFFRLLNVQGIAGIAASLALIGLLLVQKVETRHWRKQSGQYEQLYQGERAAHQTTELNYRRAADQTRAADEANAERVAAEQRTISERTSHDYETRLADARARAADAAQRLRGEAAAAATDPRDRRTAAMPDLSAAAGGTPQAAGQDRLSPEDALTATEQAIQLDELIEWVKRQAAIDPNTRNPASK